jgi:hypothetical protein
VDGCGLFALLWFPFTVQNILQVSRQFQLLRICIPQSLNTVLGKKVLSLIRTATLLTVLTWQTIKYKKVIFVKPELVKSTNVKFVTNTSQAITIGSNICLFIQAKRLSVVINVISDLHRRVI